MKKRFYIIILVLSILLLSLIFLVILLFIYQLKGYHLSNEISDWASFGDYIGGTINTLLSFFSLIILSYLTYVISQNSNKENKKLNILKRKLDVYNELTNYTPKINLSLSSSSRILQDYLLKMKQEDDVNSDNYLNAKREFINNSNFFIEFHYYMYSLKVRYSHLFKYDFSGEEFQLLLKSSKDFEAYFRSIINYFVLNEGEVLEQPDLPLFMDRFAVVVNSLRDELK